MTAPSDTPRLALSAFVIFATTITAAGITGCEGEGGGVAADLTGNLTSLTSEPSGGGGSPQIPQGGYCAAVDDWDAASAQFEQEVLDLLNERRAAAADCGIYGSFPPAAPLVMNGALRCAARNHSLDMATRGFFNHVNPDGDNPGARIAASGYSPSGWGENIAAGYPTPEAVVEGWMNSDGHCSNMMSDDFTEVGVGHNGLYWTLVFAKPR